MTDENKEVSSELDQLSAKLMELCEKLGLPAPDLTKLKPEAIKARVEGLAKKWAEQEAKRAAEALDHKLAGAAGHVVEAAEHKAAEATHAAADAAKHRMDVALGWMIGKGHAITAQGRHFDEGDAIGPHHMTGKTPEEQADHFRVHVEKGRIVRSGK